MADLQVCENMQCGDCGGPLVRIRYAKAWECPECLASERDFLFKRVAKLVGGLVLCEQALDQGISVVYSSSAEFVTMNQALNRVRRLIKAED